MEVGASFSQTTSHHARVMRRKSSPTVGQRRAIQIFKDLLDL